MLIISPKLGIAPSSYAWEDWSREGHTACPRSQREEEAESRFKPTANDTSIYLYAVLTVPSKLVLAGIIPYPFKKKRKKSTQIFVGPKLKTSLGKMGYHLILVSKVSYFSALQTSNH